MSGKSVWRGRGEVKAEKPPRPSAALFPPRPAADTKGVGRGGPVAAVGLQGQRVDPRRRWHNWKNRGGNLAGGCVRDALTAEGVLQEGVVADGVEGGVEGPVQPAQHGQQQQSGERLQELRYLPRSSGEGWARSPLRASARPRSGPRLARGPHQVLHFQGLDGGVVGEDDGLLLGLAERQQSPLALGEKP